MGASSPKRGTARSLRGRLILLTLAGTLIPIAILGWQSLSSVQTLQSRILAERQHLAESIATHLDTVLNSQFQLLAPVTPQLAAGAPGKYEVPPEVLREDYVHSQLFSGVLVLDAAGKVVESEPAGGLPSLGDSLDVPEIRAVLRGGTLAISSLWTGPEGQRRLFLFVGLRDGQGKVVGAVAGAIDPQGRRLRHLLDLAPLDPGETADLVDRQGVVIASTVPDRLYSEADHQHFLAGLIAAQKPAVGTCHSCHQDGSAPTRVNDVMAFAPLPSRPSWGVDIRQPAKQAFGQAQALRWKILGWAAGLAVLAVLFACGMATSLAGPIAQLEKTAGGIAAGQLETPVPPLGSDEVGRLGAAFERMRVALRESQDDVVRGRELLEARVVERTAETRRLYQEVQQRDRLRARLLEKLIGAQEEERRRIARELHDQTSQELGALVLALDTAIARLPEDVPTTHLQEAKGLAVRILDGVHRLSFDLRPSALDDLGLFRAIAWYADRDLKRRGVSVRCEFEGEDVRLPADVETALFRAVQEAISNIVRHARAESVLIQGAIDARAVAIEIEDDGCGFEPESISTSATSGRGLGLAGLRERVELLGGTARIESSPGHGTRVLFTVPLGGDRG